MSRCYQHFRDLDQALSFGSGVGGLSQLLHPIQRSATSARSQSCSQTANGVSALPVSAASGVWPSMTIFQLIRHGENDLLRHAIAGRSPGVSLNQAGRAQAERIAAYFSANPPQHIFSSPLERALETAEPLARTTGLKINVTEAVLEVDFGDWTRKSVDELDKLETWRQWNSFRAGGQIPNGETMIAVQRRMVGELERLRRAHPDSTIAIFSHGDPIRAAVVFYLGMPLDFILRLQANPGSIATLAINDWGAQLRGFNVVP